MCAQKQSSIEYDFTKHYDGFEEAKELEVEKSPERGGLEVGIDV